MKSKISILVALPFLVLTAGCQSTHADRDPQNPIETQPPQSAIHGDAGVQMESRNMSGVAPTRPVN
jgi:hypothetical protein